MLANFTMGSGTSYKWKDASTLEVKTDGGMWTNLCVMNATGDRFDATNQKGARFQGTWVPPAATNPDQPVTPGGRRATLSIVALRDETLAKYNAVVDSMNASIKNPRNVRGVIVQKLQQITPETPAAEALRIFRDAQAFLQDAFQQKHPDGSLNIGKPENQVGLDILENATRTIELEFRQ
jgi:hypothetical protein